MSYDYPTYPQLSQPFEAQVSILDLLFMVGPDAQHISGPPEAMNTTSFCEISVIRSVYRSSETLAELLERLVAALRSIGGEL